MIVLGLTDAAPAGAAVVIDGIVAAARDEAAPGVAARGMPRHALTAVLEQARLTAHDIDRVMVAGIDRMPSGRASGRGRTGPLLGTILAPLHALRRRDIRQILDEEFAITAPVEFVHHHLARASCAYFTSGFPDALAVTLDDGGDGDRGHVYDIRKGHFRPIGGIAVGQAAPQEETAIADFIAGHLGGNKPEDLVLSGAVFDSLALDRLIAAIDGIERAGIAPGGGISDLAPGAALSTCMLNRKEARMAMPDTRERRAPEIALV
jgi:hypothetical protein